MNMFKIVVLMKQVPDLHSDPVFKEDGTLDRSSVKSVCNPLDMSALETALSIGRSRVTVVSMGPSSAADVLYEGLYRGADEALLLSDPSFAGSDTLATSRVLAAALKKINPDLILCGDYSIDGGTSQVGPEIAQMLSIPDVRCAVSVKKAKNALSIRLTNGSVTVKGPVLVSVSNRAPECRPCNIRLYMKYSKGNCIKVMSAKELGLSCRKTGVLGSGTYVRCLKPAMVEKKERVVTGNISVLYEEGLI